MSENAKETFEGTVADVNQTVTKFSDDMYNDANETAEHIKAWLKEK